MIKNNISVDLAIIGRGSIREVRLIDSFCYILDCEDFCFTGDKRIVKSINISEFEKYVIVGFSDGEVLKIPMTSVVFMTLRE